MSDNPSSFDIHSFFVPGEELRPDTSSYIIAGSKAVVLVDPGPLEHVTRTFGDLRAWIGPDDWLFVVIQSPLPGCLSGLRKLSSLTSRRAVIAHWQTAAAGSSLLANWNVRTVSAKGAVIPLDESRQLMVSAPPSSSPAGALISIDTATQTLFSGPYFGSIGAGRRTRIPVLRRESVRAYTDLYTPQIDPRIIPLSFGKDVGVSRIAPAHGKAATGGAQLIATLFREREERPTVPWAFHRLFVRLAALAGEDAARGIYQAAGVAPPDLERGYGAEPLESADPDLWHTLYSRMESWMSSSILAAIHVVVVRLSLRSGLPIPRPLTRLGDAVKRIAAGATGMSKADARERPVMPAAPITRRTEQDAESPEFDDLTDPVTGLLNETVFRQRLESSIAYLSGEETAKENGAVLFIGLDNIQRINASYGRTGGDEALHAAAYLLRNFQSTHSRRGAHRIYKLRGPLFSYVVEEGSVNDGAELAEQLRQEVAESAMFLEQLTVSVGVIGVEELYDAELEQSESRVDALIRKGIARLSVARQSGMNTVCSIDPSAAATVSSGSSVLIADPDAPYLDLFASALRDRGFTLLTAKDGAEAIEIVNQIVPAVIISEVMLPKVNGFTFREELRHSARLSDIPFVLVSQRKSDELIEKAGLLGIVHFLRKPFSLVELLGLVQNLSRGASRT